MLVFCGLNDSKVKAKLLPIINSSHINRIYLVRDTEIDLPNVNCFVIPKYLFFPVFKIIYKFFLGLYCVVTKRVDMILGIYLVPHGILSLLVGKIMGRKTFLSMIGTDVNQELPNSRILQFLSKRNDVITVTGSKTENFLIKLGFPKDKISVISSFVEVDKFTPNKTTKDFDLIFIGSLNRNKRVNLIIDAFSELNENSRMVILGKGSLRKSYIDYANKMGVLDRIVFAGYRKNVIEFLHSSKILVLASKSEGLPQCVMEAMSCGLPCVVPKINDITDLVVNNTNSLYFDSSNVIEFRLAIEKLLSDEIFYSHISKNARKSIIANFSIEAGTKKWNHLLQ